jgi:hypothetical protein
MKAKPKLSMCCWLESRRATPERRAAWHKDCVIPATCSCPAHRADKPGTADIVLPSGRADRSVMAELLGPEETRHLEIAEGRWFLPGPPP